MTTVYGNRLTFATFDYLKVNETTIKLPDISKKDYKLKSDEKVQIKEFQTMKYGISKEAIDINEEYGNLYRYYETKENEKKDYGVLRLSTDDENTDLLDTHDIQAGESSDLKLILDYSSEGEKEKFRHSIIRILARKNSNVKVFIIQKEADLDISCESIAIYTEENANVEVYQYELGAGRLYTNYQADIRGDQSGVKVDSIYFGYHQHELDLLYNISHYGKETTSDIIVNGVIKDECRKVFKSNLDFKKGSTKSEGSEEEYVVIMHDTAGNISVPILLCHEDDVKGNHAASAGKIDPEILFYIMSRGFNKAEAEKIIIESKFSSTIDALENEEIEDEVWGFVNKIIKGKLDA